MNNEIEKLKSQVEQIQKTISDLEKKEKKKCYQIKKVNFGEEYYTVDSWFTVQKQINRDWEPDFYYYRSFNYFTDENKAKQYADHIKLELELFQIRDRIRDGWTPDWTNGERKYFVLFYNGDIYVDYQFSYYHAFSFQSNENANKFLELVGKDKIKQYLSFL